MTVLITRRSEARVTQNDGNIAPVWVQWFQQLWNRTGGGSGGTLASYDTGVWTPVLSGAAIIGSVAAAGNYSKIGNQVFWNCYLIPSGGSSITSTINITKINGLPYIAQSYGTLTAINVSTRICLGSGQVDATTASAYVPSWTATGNTIYINGFYQTAS